MKRMSAVPLLLMAVVSCSDSGPGGPQFLALLSGLNEVPPVLAALAGASASFTPNGSNIDYVITVQNITGVTGAGIYVGAAGVVGPKVADLYAGGTTGAIASGTLVAGTLTPAGLTAVSLDSLQVLMQNGGAYVNIQTTAQPSGEIRGQVYHN